MGGDGPGLVNVSASGFAIYAWQADLSYGMV